MEKREFGRRELMKGMVASSIGMGALATREGMTKAVQAAEKVPTRPLGTSGAEIPILLMGCGQTLDFTYDRLLHRVFKEGVFYLDTAQQYDNGNSHRSVGAFVEQVGRKNVWLTSKVPMEGAGSSVKHYLTNLDKMMPELKTDWLDAFFMHGLNNPAMLEPEYVRMADKLKKEGRIKHFGFSCHHGNVVELMNKAAKIGAPGIDMIMFRYSFAAFGDLELNKAIDNCVKAGIGLIAMKTQRSIPAEKEDVVKFQSENFTLPQAKLKSVWTDGRIAAAVSEMTNTQQISDNIAAAKSNIQLSMNEYMQLNQFAAQTAEHACMGCSHKCESAIDADVQIAHMLRYKMYADSYGNAEVGRRLYAQLAANEKAIDGVDFSKAEVVCPQGIRIEERLKEARGLLA